MDVDVDVVVLLRPTLKGILWWMVWIRQKVCGSIIPSGRREDIIMLLHQRSWILMLEEVDLEAVVDMEHLVGMARLDNVVMEVDVAEEEGVEALRWTQSALNKKDGGTTTPLAQTKFIGLLIAHAGTARTEHGSYIAPTRLELFEPRMEIPTSFHHRVVLSNCISQ